MNDIEQRIVDYRSGLEVIRRAMSYIKSCGGRNYLFDENKMDSLALLSERAGYVFDAIIAATRELK